MHGLYRQLRETAPVLWDPYLHAWVVTGYAEVVKVLQTFSADRTPSPSQLKAMGMAQRFRHRRELREDNLLRRLA